MSQHSSLKSTVAVSLTNYLDAGAIVAGASGLTLWQKYLGLSEVHLGWLNFISANCLGAAIGAIIGGFLADRYGRKFIFTYNLLVYMTGVLLVLLSVNFPMLLAGFLITGISVGGETLAGDALNVFSSRVVFFSLFVVAFIAWNLQRGLQESSEFEATQASGKKTGLIDNIRVLFQNRIALGTACFLAAIYLTWNLVASVLGFFLPHIYETAGGISNEQANWIASTQWMATVVTTLGLSFLLDRISHRFVYILGLLIAISAWVLIVTVGVNSRAVLWGFALLWGVQSGLSVQIFYALWGSELFPAKFRAGAQGLMFFVVRGLSAVWGIVFTMIYGPAGEGFTLASWCMILLLVISLVVGVIGCPDTRGKSLEQITRERYGENY